MDEKIKALEELLRTRAFREGAYYPFTLCDGTEGYFELMLFDVGSWALCAYAGEEAVQQYLCTAVNESATDAERLEAVHSMDSLLLSVSGEEVSLTRYEPRRIPRDMNKQEQSRMEEILSAALSAPKAAKLPGKRKRTYPAGECQNELTARKMKTVERNGQKWLAHIFLHVGAIEPEEGGEPFFPYMLMLLEEKSGLMLTAGISSTPENYNEGFLTMLADAIAEHGKPKAIISVNERSRDYFKPLCASLGIEFEKRSSSPTLRKAMEDYLRLFGEQEETEPADESGPAELPEAEQTEDEAGWNEIDSILLRLVSDPTALPQLSTELLLNLLTDMENGDMDSSLVDVIREELRKR